MFNKLIRQLLHLVWDMTQILLLSIGYVLMAIGKAWMALFHAVVNFGKAHMEDLLTFIWLTVYALIIVKIIKAIIRK